MTGGVAVVVAVVWLVAMLGVFGALVWWDRRDGRDETLPTFVEVVDRAAARALDGDEGSEEFLWDLLIDYLICYRNRRVAMEHVPERARA